MNSKKQKQNAKRSTLMSWPLGTAAALLMLSSSLTAAAQHSDWQTIQDFGTYEVVENGVTTQKNYSDVANTTDEIVALIQNVYTNKKIPGTRALPDGKKDDNGEIVHETYVDYLDKNSKGWYDWYPATERYLDDEGKPKYEDNNPDGDNITPYQDGLTMLMWCSRTMLPKAPSTAFVSWLKNATRVCA